MPSTPLTPDRTLVVKFHLQISEIIIGKKWRCLQYDNECILFPNYNNYWLEYNNINYSWNFGKNNFPILVVNGLYSNFIGRESNSIVFDGFL